MSEQPGTPPDDFEVLRPPSARDPAYRTLGRARDDDPLAHHPPPAGAGRLLLIIAVQALILVGSGILGTRGPSTESALLLGPVAAYIAGVLILRAGTSERGVSSFLVPIATLAVGFALSCVSCLLMVR